MGRTESRMHNRYTDTYHVGCHQLASVLVNLAIPLQEVPVCVVGLPPLRQSHRLQLPHKVELRRTPVGAEEQLAALLNESDGRFEIQSTLCAGEHYPYICYAGF